MDYIFKDYTESFENEEVIVTTEIIEEYLLYLEDEDSLDVVKYNMKVLGRKFENLEKDAKTNGWSSQVKICNSRAQSLSEIADIITTASLLIYIIKNHTQWPFIFITKYSRRKYFFGAYTKYEAQSRFGGPLLDQ